MPDLLATPHVLAVTVHGPAGVVDLVVPAGAVAADVAEEYARLAGLATAPDLCTRVGAPLPADVELGRAGIGTGDLLVATAGAPPPATRRTPDGCVRAGATHPATVLATVLVGLWFVVAAALAAVAGWCATVADGAPRAATLALLAAGAIVGVAPAGRYPAYRVVAAPVFGAAAALAVLWDPLPERLPMVVGVAGLTAALVAAVGRALAERAEEALRVWIVAGSGLFLLTGLCTLAGAPPRVTWSVLLVAAVLAARFVPGLAVDVPDQYLVDLERLAVTAWSARTRPPGRRGRSVVPLAAVAVVAGRGTRIVTAAGTAVLGAVGVGAPLLLATATLPIDRVGARCLVLVAGAALLLAGRSYRHAAARHLLRAAGLVCWVALLAVVLPTLGAARRSGGSSPARRSWRSCWSSSPSPWAAAGARRGGRAGPRSPRGCAARSSWRRSWWPPAASASCGSWRACGNSVLEV